MGELTKDRLANLKAIEGTEINSIEMENVKRTCAEFVSEFSNKFNKVTKYVTGLV